MEATASFALKDSKVRLDNHDMLKRLRQTPSPLRQLYHKHPNASQHLVMPSIWVASFHTNMYSQFSDVRFSSVALAVLMISRCLELSGGKLTNGIVKCILLRSKHSCY